MTDTDLDGIYEVADILMKKGRWSLIDDLLEYYGNSAWRQDIDLLLAWATITNVARKKLKNRKRFLESCMNFHKDPELWKGLWEENTDPIPFLKSIGLAGDVEE